MISLYNDLQLFVKSIGEVELKKKGMREILIVMLVDKDVNIGIIILQMNKFATLIREAIRNDDSTLEKLKMNETEFKDYLKDLKKNVFELT